MRPATSEGRPEETALPEAARRARLPPAVVTAAGPALIVAAVITMYRGYVFHGLLTSRHVDMLSYSLPNFCFLGKTLSAGQIALWNPYTLGGTPFAADPQSGWMYLPAMLTFAALPCGTAMRWFIVLQPLLAGLGMYWFLRGEALSRIAATVGGLVLAFSLVGSLSGVMLAFAGVVAWLPILLGAASRCLRARTWPGRLGWCVGTALAWGQLAASFLTTGVMLGTVALVAYGVARSIIEIRGGRLDRTQASILSAIVLVSLPVVNLAYLWPRLAYLPRTTITSGYEQLQQLTPDAAVSATAQVPTWPLKFVASPGTYLGVAALALVFAAWGSRALRDRLPIIVALTSFGTLAYLLTLRSVDDWVAQLPVSGTVASILVHVPFRNLYGVLFALAALAGFGVAAWFAAGSARERALLLAPGIVVWGALPVLAGVDRSHLVLPLVAGGIGLLLLVIASRRPVWATLLPLLVAAELCVNAAVGQNASKRPDLGILYPAPLAPPRAPNIDAAAYLRPGRITTALRQPRTGRFLGFDPQAANHRGYLTFGDQGPGTWGLLVNQRAILFELEDVQGYSSVQLRRYWSFVRAANPRRIDYNAAVFLDLPPVVVDLLQVNWLVVRAADHADLPRGARPQAAEGGWELYALRDAIPRASVVDSWQVVGTEGEALSAVMARGFDPLTNVVLEHPPTFGPPGSTAVPGSGSVTYQPLGLQSARITVATPTSAIVIVRNPYDENWKASVDGKPVAVLAADYMVQGIPVARGEHTIVLSYEDPTIGYGLAGTGASICLLLGFAIGLTIKGRRKERTFLA